MFLYAKSDDNGREYDLENSSNNELKKLTSKVSSQSIEIQRLEKEKGLLLDEIFRLKQNPGQNQSGMTSFFD